MDERTDRLKRFMSQPITQYMTRLHRVRGVNGKAIHEYQRDRRISLRTRFNIFRNYRRSHHEIATLGAVGASLSHIDAWKLFVASGEPFCLILEDDARITPDTIHEVHRIWKDLPESWGMWLLGYYEPNMVKEPLSATPWNSVYSYTAAHAYILRRDVAIKLIEDAFPIEMHIDHYMSTCSTIKGFNILQHPAINVSFWGVETSSRVSDSNTSQHKKRSCTVCNVPDNNTLLFQKFTRKGKKGTFVSGVIKNNRQSDLIRTFRNTRKLRPL